MNHPASQPDPEIWQRASDFAARAHRHATWKDGHTPYVTHVFRVAMICRHIFECNDDRVITAALLHDTIEDTDTDFDDIADEFGTEVAQIVAALTKNMLLPGAEREADNEERLARATWHARLIKLADTYDNLANTVTDPAYPAPVSDRIHKAQRALALARDNAPHATCARQKLGDLIHKFQVAQGDIA